MAKDKEYFFKVLRGRRTKTVTYWVDNNDCWICNSHRTCGGYPRIKTAEGKNTRMHRAVFIDYFHITNISSKIVVRHECNNKLCINPNHLLPGFSKHNTEDMVRAGSLKGIKNPTCVLTENQALEIKNNTTDSSKDLQERHNVTRYVVYGIQKGRTWAWL